MNSFGAPRTARPRESGTASRWPVPWRRQHRGSRSGRGSCRPSIAIPGSSPRRPRRSTRSAAGGSCSEALRIIVPLIRTGHADFEGQYHAARDLPQQPVGPRPNAIPLLIGGNGPKGQRHAALHADIWSGYAEERAHVDELGPRLATLDAICDEVGRDPATIGRGAGISVNPTQPAGWRPTAISGPAEEIADTLRSFREAGFTQVDLMLGPGTLEAVEALAPVLELVRAD